MQQSGYHRGFSSIFGCFRRSFLLKIVYHYSFVSTVVYVYLFLSWKTTPTSSKTLPSNSFTDNLIFAVFNPQRIETNEDEIFSLQDRNVSTTLESRLAQQNNSTSYSTSATDTIHYYCAVHAQYGSIQLDLEPANSFKIRRDSYAKQHLRYFNGTQEHVENLLSSHLTYVPSRNFFGADQVLAYCIAHNAGLLADFEEELEQKQKKQLRTQGIKTSYFDWYSFLSVIVNPINDLPTIVVNKTSFVAHDNDSAQYLQELLHGVIRIMDDDDDDDSVIGLPFNFPSTYMVNISVSHQEGGHGVVKLPPKRYLGGLTIREDEIGDSVFKSNSIAIVGPLSRINIALSHVLFDPKQSRPISGRTNMNNTNGIITIQCWDIPREFRRTKAELFIPNATYTNKWATDLQTISFEIVHVNRAPTVTFTCRKHSHTYGVLQTHEDEPFVFCRSKSSPCLLELDDSDSHPQEDQMSLNLTVVAPTATAKSCVIQFQLITADNLIHPSNNSCMFFIQGTLTYLRGVIEQMQIVFIPHWYGHARLYVSLSDSHGATDNDDILFIVLPINDPPSLVATFPNITVRSKTPTLLSTLTSITAHDPDVFVFTTSSRNSRRPPTFTVTINATGCCGLVKFSKKVAGSYIVTNQQYDNIEDYLGPYSSVTFRGTLDVINEVMSSVIYFSSCESNSILPPHHQPLYNGELSLLLVDEGYFGKAGEGIGTVGNDEKLLEANLSILIHSIEDESASLVPSIHSHSITSMSSNEFLGIADSWQENDREEQNVDNMLNPADTEDFFNRTEDVSMNAIARNTTPMNIEDDDYPAVIYWNDVPLTHQEIVLYMVENTQLHLNLYSRQLGNGGGISILRQHNMTYGWDSNISIFITTEFGHLCEANSSQLIYDDLPQEYVIISEKNENENCMSTEKIVNRSVILFQGSLTEVNKRLSHLVYVPPSDKWGVDKVKFMTNTSSILDSDMGLFEVVIKPMDDVPLIHINGTKEGLERVPSTWEILNISVEEDIPLLLPEITISDRDTKPHPFLNSKNPMDNTIKMLADSMLLVDLKFSALHGRIKINGEDKEVSLRFNDSETLLSGHLNRINKVLSFGISYQGNLNFHGADIIVIQSQNQYVIPQQEKAMQISFFRRISVKILQVNDAPYIIMPPSPHGVLFAVEDTPAFIGATCKDGTEGSNLSPSIISCQGIELHDPESDRLSVTVSVNNGRLSFLQPLYMKKMFKKIITNGSFELPNRVFTLKGTVNEINQLLYGMIFRADRNFNFQVGGLVILKVFAEDLQGASTSGQLAINVAPVNDPPVLLSSFDVVDSSFRTTDELSFKRVGCRALEAKEDKLTSVSGVNVRDVDTEMSRELVEIEIFTSNGGLLIIAEDSRIENWIFGSRGVFSNRLHFQSPVDEANEALHTLHYQSALNFNGPDAIHLRVSDLVDSQSTVCGLSHPTFNVSEEHEDYLVIPVEVLGVADAPVMVIPDLLELREDTQSLLYDKFSVYHDDGNNSIVHIKLQCEHCELILNSAENMESLRNFTAGPSVDMLYYQVEGTGSVTEWNLCLVNLTYIPSSNWNTKGWSLDELSFVIRNVDLEFPMIAQESKTFVTLVDVKAVNDAPVWTVPGQHLKLQNTGGYIISSVDTLHADEDKDLVIESVSILDEDMMLDRWSTCDALHITLKVTSGTIDLATNAGLWIQQNHTRSILDWKGKIGHSNAALSKIYYRGNPNFYGDDKLELYVSDQGCEGDGDIMTSSVTVPIAVHPINDNPYWVVPWDPILCRKGELYCSIKGIEVKDSDGEDSTTFVRVHVGHGSISFSEAELPPFIEFTEGNWLFRDSEFHFHGRLKQANVLLSRMRYYQQDVESANIVEGTVLIRLVVTDSEAVGKEIVQASSSSRVGYVLLQMVD